uniref:Uncharacterized protein n=1 Tax=Naja naja TaxID=35670 RepID=A0A8C6XWM7_NAJNA
SAIQQEACTARCAHTPSSPRSLSFLRSPRELLLVGPVGTHNPCRAFKPCSTCLNRRLHPACCEGEINRLDLFRPPSPRISFHLLLQDRYKPAKSILSLSPSLLERRFLGEGIERCPFSTTLP